MRHINRYKLSIKITKLILIFWHNRFCNRFKNRFCESIVKSIVKDDFKIERNVFLRLF